MNSHEFMQERDKSSAIPIRTMAPFQGDCSTAFMLCPTGPSGGLGFSLELAEVTSWLLVPSGAVPQ